jgi:hypothetical protein
MLVLVSAVSNWRWNNAQVAGPTKFIDLALLVPVRKFPQSTHLVLSLTATSYFSDSEIYLVASCFFCFVELLYYLATMTSRFLNLAVGLLANFWVCFSAVFTSLFICSPRFCVVSSSGSSLSEIIAQISVFILSEHHLLFLGS